ncbi:MAG TPA: hypothetical protein VKX49_12420 [Bryobacteraceae bacterium]|nr:hypothetical protein [Bryobacteraceae bacterium]
MAALVLSFVAGFIVGVALVLFLVYFGGGLVNNKWDDGGDDSWPR